MKHLVMTPFFELGDVAAVQVQSSRVDSLLAAMTLAEKISLLHGAIDPTGEAQEVTVRIDGRALSYWSVEDHAGVKATGRRPLSVGAYMTFVCRRKSTCAEADRALVLCDGSVSFAQGQGPLHIQCLWLADVGKAPQAGLTETYARL